MITNPDQTGGLGRAWDRFTAPTERYRRPFRRWRRGRPFFAGLSVLIAGVEITLITRSGLDKLLRMGLPGVSTMFISVFLALFAVTIWFFPAYRVFSGIASIMLGLLSLVASNIGGFALGFLLAMFGGSFAVAWTPRADYSADTRRQRRRAAAPSAAADPGPRYAPSPASQFPESAGDAGSTETAESVAAAQGETAGPGAEAEATDTGAASAAEPAVVDAAEHADNARIIEQYARSDDAPADPPEPSPEEE